MGEVDKEYVSLMSTANYHFYRAFVRRRRSRKEIGHEGPDREIEEKALSLITKGVNAAKELTMGLTRNPKNFSFLLLLM